MEEKFVLCCICEIGARQRVRKQEEGTMRRWIWRALLLVAVMAALTVGAAAAGEEISGAFGYTLEGTAYTITSYRGNSDTVTLPSEYKGVPVTKIGDGVFSGKGLTSIKNLGNIKEIGDMAFAASGLKSIEIPGTVTSIGKSAFATCSGLTSVTFLDSAETGTGSANTAIGPNAFAACSLLSTLNLSSGVSSIGNSAFLGCRELTEVYVWGTSSIGPSAFSGCGKLSRVAISGGVTTIGADAFVPSDKLKVIHYGGDSFPASAQWTGDVHKATVENIITPARCETKGASAKIVLCLKPVAGCPSVSTREEIAELGHDIVHTLVSSDPSGYKPCQDHTDSYKDTCSRCSYEREYEVKVSAESPHDWEDDIEDTANSKQPTDCKTPGVKRFKHVCKVCGEEEPVSKTEPIPALSHKYETKTVTIREATCSETGLSAEQEICSVCQDIKACETCEKLKGDQEKYEQHIMDAHGGAVIQKKDHTPGESKYVVTTPATCEKEGEETWKVVCSVCKQECGDDPMGALDHPARPVPALGHDLAGGIETITKEPTCTEPGEKTVSAQKCKREGCPFKKPEQTGVKVDPLGHDLTAPVDKINAVPATCKEEGEDWLNFRECKRKDCDYEEKKVVKKRGAHTWESPKADPDKESEDKAPTCGEEGVSHVITTCSVCGETERREIKLPATGKHNYEGSEWTTVKNPTATEDGLQERPCMNPGCTHKDSQIIPATGEPSDPGDPDDPDKPTDPEKPKTYSITLVQGAGGTASVSRTTAQEGDRITVTLSPNSGYELDMIRAIGGGTDVLSLTDLGGGQHRFTMPASNVEIRVTFERTNSGSGWATAPGDSSGGSDARRTSDVMPTQNATLGVPQTGASEQRFRDVPVGHWAAGEIEWANQMGYMNGTGGRFNPNGNITNQQMWMILARLTGSNPANMAEARHWAVQGGYADGSSPTGPVKRHQLVTALYRCARLSGSMNRNTTSLAGYNDSRNVPAVARDAFSWALANGIISGSADKNLMPNGYITRAQFAVILYRYSQRV